MQVKNNKETRSKIDLLCEYYQINKKLPTIEENEELALFFEQILKKEVRFLGEYAQKMRDLKYQVVFDELLAYVKKYHELPNKDILSSFNTSLLYAYSNYLKGKYPFLNYNDKIELIKKYCDYTYSNAKDIISYYREHNELPPIGTYNELGEDIGQYSIDLIDGKIYYTERTKKLLLEEITLVPYSQRIKHNDRMVDTIIEMKKNKTLNISNDPAIYYFYRSILTGRKKLTKEQEDKLKEVGIVANSKEVVSHPTFNGRRRPLSQNEKDELIEESYQYIKNNKEFPNPEVLTKNNIPLRRFIMYLLRYKYVLNAEQKEKVLEMIKILDESEKKSAKKYTTQVKKTDRDSRIDEFVKYTNENYEFPNDQEKIMNFILKCYSGGILITRDQLHKLETVLPFNGKNYRLIEKEIKINEIIKRLKENNAIEAPEEEKEKILTPMLYEFLCELRKNNIVVSRELKNKLKEIGINVSNTREYSSVKSNFAKNQILLNHLENERKQLITLRNELEKLLENKEKEKEKMLRRF